MSHKLCPRRNVIAEIAFLAVILSWLPAFTWLAHAAVEELSGPYLGQNAPGSTPRLFASGIVSVRADFEHSAATFSPDRQEIYWCTNVGARTNPPGAGQKLYVMRQIDGVWTTPEIAPFTQDIAGAVQRPVFSPDGTRLYFEVLGEPPANDDSDIYVVEREADGWSEPTPMFPAINTASIERLHCITPDGSMIFSRNPFTDRERMYLSRFVEGAFTEPEVLGEPFDSPAHELAVVIAPDESYALIAVTYTGLEDELYISYKQADGAWSERIRAPYACGGFLAISPDGAYLFFLGEGIYWVDTSFVERSRTEDVDRTG